MTTRTISKTIRRSWMETNGLRLDSGPYLSGAFEARVAIKRFPKERIMSLREVTKGGMGGIYNGPQFVRNYVDDPDYGVPFLSSGSMLLADMSRVALLSKRDAETTRLSYLRLNEGTTLITCSGTIGRMAYVRPDMEGFWSSQDVMKVVPDPDRILPGYLYAYLSSRFGVPQIVSGTYGAIIQHIEPHHIAGLPVPRLMDDVELCVHELIAEAAQLRCDYQRQVKAATDLLFESVGLRDITASEWHTQGPDVGFTHRSTSAASLRALNFNPRFQYLCGIIQATSWRSLDHVCIRGTLGRGGRYKRIDAEQGQGCQLIGQRQLFWQRPEGRSVAAFALGEDVFVEPGTVLVAARGTLGEGELYCRSEFIWDAGTELAYSEDMLRIVANEKIMMRGCLFAFLRSEMAFRMFRSISMGSKMQDHHTKLLPQLPIPYPTLDIQIKIHNLIVDAYEKRHRSNALENEAVALVERAITEGP